MNVVLFNDSSNSIDDSNNLCEAFNDHFATIGPKLAEEIPCIENLSQLDYLSPRA